MQQFEYMKTSQYFAQVPPGVETPAKNELVSLGANRIRPVFRGIYFTATPAVLYKINYSARLVTRILAPLVSFECGNRNDLYCNGFSVKWEQLFSKKNTFGIFANVSGNSELRHSKFAALCLKDAVADRFRKTCGARPDVDRSQPDVWLNLHIVKTRATISLDTSGGSLHRRGYRKATVDAPMKETLAAAMVAFSGWKGDSPLFDPMCGSGTLLCEAMMTACRIPAGFLRPSFGFRYLPDFDEHLWNDTRKRCDDHIRPIPAGLVAGSDISRKSVDAAISNTVMLPDGKNIRVFRSDYKSLTGLEGRTVLCNPPYGIRLQKEKNLGEFYKAFGDFLKKQCKGSNAFVFFGNREMIKKVGLRASWKKPVRNAGIDGRIVKYELY